MNISTTIAAAAPVVLPEQWSVMHAASLNQSLLLIERRFEFPLNETLDWKRIGGELQVVQDGGLRLTLQQFEFSDLMGRPGHTFTISFVDPDTGAETSAGKMRAG